MRKAKQAAIAIDLEEEERNRRHSETQQERNRVQAHQEHETKSGHEAFRRTKSSWFSRFSHERRY